MAALVRESVERMLSETPEFERRAALRRSLQALGAFHSGRSDIAERHDEYLAEIYAEEDGEE